MALAERDFAANSNAVIARWLSRESGTRARQLNPLVGTALGHAKLGSKTDVARIYGELIRRVNEEARRSAGPTSAGLDDPARQIRSILCDHDSPAYFPKSQTWAYMSRGEKDEFGRKLTELDRMTARSENAAHQGHGPLRF